MNIRSLLTIVVGLGLAGGATYLAGNLTQTNLGTAEAMRPDVTEIVVARSEIASGQIIERHMLATQDWPTETIPVGVFVDIESLLPQNGLEPRRALGRIFQDR